MSSVKRSLLNLQSLSKDELIKIITEKCPEIVNAETSCVEKKRKIDKAERKFDASEYECKMVALKVAYFGFKYQGFASQTGLLNIFNNAIPKNAADTVEDHLFRAMVRTRLVLDPKTCNYSRCGRTDAGVSSTGQVIALKLRTSNKKKVMDVETVSDGIDYVNVLNKQLPDDIRILNWAFVPEDFSARFSCSSRLYHYHFSRIHYDPISRETSVLDIEAMQEAVKLLVGVHDFRNFCKRDPSKPEQSFTREILECYIEESKEVEKFYTFVCRGSAFLYHQIRCIMAILFLIGTKSEPVELITTMLDKIDPKNTEAPTGPLAHYEIASGIPLTLRECFYEKPGSERIKWTYNDDKDVVNSHLLRMWESKQGEALIINGLVKKSGMSSRKTVSTLGLLQKFIDASK